MEEVKANKMRLEAMGRELEMMNRTSVETTKMREKMEMRMGAALTAAGAVPMEVAEYEDAMHTIWDDSFSIHENASKLLERDIVAAVGKVRAGGSLEEFEARVAEQMGVFRKTIRVFFEHMQPQWAQLSKQRLEQMAVMMKLMGGQEGA